MRIPRKAQTVIRKTITACIALFGFSFPFIAYASGVPQLKADAPDLKIETKNITSALVVDIASGKTLYALNPGKVWSAASLTKLMTSTVFTSVPRNWNAKGNIVKSDEVGGGRLQVPVGSKMTLRDLLNSALVGSANNAANALARLSGMSRASFVSRMNTTASQLGMTKTTFVDSSGMGPKNVTTAADLVLLLRRASEQPEIRKAMTTPTYHFAISSPKAMDKTIKNTNELLFTEPNLAFSAGKTGFLYESMYNFVTQVRPDASSNKKEVAVIVFGGQTRAISQDTALALAQWSWDAYSWSTSTPAFTKNYVLGDRGPGVKTLQKYLNANGYAIAKSGPGSKGKETELYGALTQAALKKFQDAHAKEILTPLGRTKGSGALDDATRAYLNAG
jgi:serine-type D-Ala-D-Ala endopeptidase (penicillin-binding protein 7)